MFFSFFLMTENCFHASYLAQIGRYCCGIDRACFCKIKVGQSQSPFYSEWCAIGH